MSFLSCLRIILSPRQRYPLMLLKVEAKCRRNMSIPRVPGGGFGKCSGILVPVFGVIDDDETPALLMSRGCDVLVAVSLVARCVFYSHTTP